MATLELIATTADDTDLGIQTRAFPGYIPETGPGVATLLAPVAGYDDDDEDDDIFEGDDDDDSEDTFDEFDDFDNDGDEADGEEDDDDL